MCGEVTGMAERAQVVRVEHQCLLIGGGECVLDWLDVVHLCGGCDDSLGEAVLAQGIGCQLRATELHPSMLMYQSTVFFILCHSLFIYHNLAFRSSLSFCQHLTISAPVVTFPPQARGQKLMCPLAAYRATVCLSISSACAACFWL